VRRQHHAYEQDKLLFWLLAIGKIVTNWGKNTFTQLDRVVVPEERAFSIILALRLPAKTRRKQWIRERNGQKVSKLPHV
jgi:hypothetical protein